MSREGKRLVLAAIVLLASVGMASFGAEDEGPSLRGQTLGGCEIEVRPKGAPPIVPLLWNESVTTDEGGAVLTKKWTFKLRAASPDLIMIGDRTGHDELKVLANADSTVTFEYVVQNAKLSLTYDDGANNTKTQNAAVFTGTFDPLSIALTSVELLSAQKPDPSKPPRRQIVRTHSSGIVFDWTISDNH